MLPFRSKSAALVVIGSALTFNLAQAQTVTAVDHANVTTDDVMLELLGDAIAVEDVEYLGNDQQLGLFLGYEYLFGDAFDHGVVLSTGKVTSVVAQQNDTDKTSTEFSANDVTDIDLGEHIYDPAKLTIRFTPQFSQITLDFIFGSEEYNEYVHSDYNDRLEILVNGENCAKTPDGQSFSINTVNDRSTYPPIFGDAGESSNPDLYINNDPGQDQSKNGSRAESSVAAYATEMDGFTKLLQCSAAVNPNEENTLIIGILDKGDAKLDSWVFFNANSLQAVPSDEERDTDQDGIPDAFDLDADNDGIADSIEAPNGQAIDSDGDGLPDYLDLDSDNDGIPDSIEYTGNPNSDPNNDGLVENQPTLQAPVDTDGDGIPDYLDVDSDNDKLPDLYETSNLAGLDSDGDGRIDDFVDADNDGLAAQFDPDEGGTPLVLLDIDSDSLTNYRDTDSDGDQFDDAIENGDYDGDGTNDRLQKETGLKTAVSGVGSFGFEWLLGLPLLLLGRKSRKA